MKKDSGQRKPAAGGAKTTGADRGVEQRNRKQDQAAQLSPANIEESPYMDRGDSAAGSGESLEEGRESAKVAEQLRRGAPDTQYGTYSTMKTGERKSGQAGRVSSAGSGSSGSGEDGRPAPNPGSSEASSGTERDTMSGSRPGSR
jgi:hypothetical protein